MIFLFFGIPKLMEEQNGQSVTVTLEDVIESETIKEICLHANISI